MAVGITTNAVSVLRQCDIDGVLVAKVDGQAAHVEAFRVQLGAVRS